MKKYLLHKFISLIFVLFGISIIAFFLGVLSPGDPAELALSRGGIYSPTPEQIEHKREKLGLDRPLTEQYISWLKGIFQGNLGHSYQTNESVQEILMRKLPVTIKIAVLSLFITLFFGVTLGMLSAIYRDTWVDILVSNFANVILSLPSFWISLLGIYFFAEIWGILPTSGQESFKHYLLPCFSLSLVTMAMTIRLMKASMLKEFGEHYVLTAQTRGLKGYKLYVKNILPHAILPVLPMIGNYFGSILGGSAIIESIFSFQGIGNFALEAVRMKDFPFLQFYVLLTGGIFVVVTTLVEILGMLIDPRVRLGGENHEQR